MINIKKYGEYLILIKEGLIRTHNILQYETSLSNKLNKYKIQHTINIIDKLEFQLIIQNPLESDLQWIINECINLYGYYPSYYFIEMTNGLKNQSKWSDFKYLPNITEIKINFEAKYSDSVYTNDIVCPNKLYHLTYQENINKISKIGLYPKTYNRISDHSSRIYLFPDMSQYQNLLSTLKRSDKINNLPDKKYSLLEIETDNILILHTDPNYRLGYYTYDNIHPSKIKIL